MAKDSEEAKRQENQRKKEFTNTAKEADILGLQQLVLNLYKDPCDDLSNGDFKKTLRQKLRKGIFSSNDTLCSILEKSMGDVLRDSVLKSIDEASESLCSLQKKIDTLIKSADTSSYAVYELYLFSKWLELLNKHITSCSEDVARGQGLFVTTLFQIYDFTQKYKNKNFLLFTAENIGDDIQLVINYLRFICDLLPAATEHNAQQQKLVSDKLTIAGRGGKTSFSKGKKISNARTMYEAKVGVFNKACGEFSSKVCDSYVVGLVPFVTRNQRSIASVIESCFGYLGKVNKTSATKRWYNYAIKQAKELDNYNENKNSDLLSSDGTFPVFEKQKYKPNKQQIKLWNRIWTTPFSMSGRATVKDPRIKKWFNTFKSKWK